MITCPACHKKSKAGKTCSRCGIDFEHWLSGQISSRSQKLQPHTFLPKRNLLILIFSLAAIIGASKIFDFLRTRQQATGTAAEVSIENLDTPEKILMEMARRANDKSANLDELKARLLEFDLARSARQEALSPAGKDQSWNNGLAPNSTDPENLVRGRDWQGRKTFEIDNR